jgi:hypothetical protein
MTLKETAVEWLESELDFLDKYMAERDKNWLFEQAKTMEKEQKGYTEEQAKQIWKAGQEYWKTSGSSITFEELIEKFKVKQEIVSL